MEIQGFTIPRKVLDYVSYGDPEHGQEWLETKLREVRREFDELVPWLPKHAGGMLDIGCGLGAIDILIARELGLTSVHLLDGVADKPEERRKFAPEGTKAWNDVRIAEELVGANLSAPEDYATTVNAYSDPERVYIACDLVISLKSWGHHYPVDTYLPLVLRSLRQGGCVIIDLRHGNHGEAGRFLLDNAGLKFRGRIGGTEKCDRVIFARP